MQRADAVEIQGVLVVALLYASRRESVNSWNNRL